MRLVVVDVTARRPEPSPARRPSRSANRPRVLLVTDNRLLGESVAYALDGIGFETAEVVWPEIGAPDDEVRRRMAIGNPRVGVMFGDMHTKQRIVDAADLVRAVPLRWLLVVADPRDPSWGAFVNGGVSAVVPTSMSLDRLGRSLLQVMTFDQVGHRTERERLMTDWKQTERRRTEAASRFASLSPREILVLDRLYEGISVKNIAARDGVSEATVRTQVKAVLRKLDVSSQLAAVAEYRKVKGDGRDAGMLGQ